MLITLLIQKWMLYLQADSSSGQITLDSETMTFAGGTNVTTAASGNTVTINLS